MVFSGHDSLFTLPDIISVDLPSVDHSQTEIPTMGGHVFKRTSGNPINFTELSLEFLLDETLETYFFFLNWMLNNSNPYTGEAGEDVRTGTLMVMSEDDRILREIEFFGLQPISLPSVRFETNTDDTSFDVTSISLSLDYFKEKMNKQSDKEHIEIMRSRR